MTSDKIFICEQQQDFFKYTSSLLLDMYSFIPLFMKSDFCNRELDSTYSFFQYADILDWEDFLKKEIKFTPEPLKKEKISKEIAGWLGYMYRYIQIESKIHSNVIIEKIPLEKLLRAYTGLHTVDETMAYDIIQHDFKL